MSPKQAGLPKTVPQPQGAAYELDEHTEEAVYRRGGTGAAATPTGRVFVRFAAGTDARAQAGALAAAGFTLEAVPAYAANAAWVRPASGRLADALTGFERLLAVPGVENVEPQFETEAAPR
jgi:hypothetical protein